MTDQATRDLLAAGTEALLAAAFRTGDYTEAETLLRHVDDLTRSEVHRHVGFHYLVRDIRPERAIEHLTISQDLRDSHGDPRWIPSGIVALGEEHLEFGHRDEAVRLLRDAVRLAEETNLHPRRIGWARDALRRAESPDA